ncbi:DUF6443 domain-containing protein [Flavobacterium sp. TBRC 19031]|uniref:DUF6443 domain-containing protein n=1 Tax=Flavobacterium mekongense TaxID=3379707 RepID=UPI00399A29A1
MKKILYSLLFLPIMVIGQTTTQNYVKTKTYKQPTTTSIASPTPEQATQTVTYFDGLGRPIQQNANAQSSSGKDIVTHIEYDAFGRQSMEYLPYVSIQNDMLYISGETLKTNTVQQYVTNYNDPVAFSEKLFEASPLNRVLKQGAPGSDWAVNGNHAIIFEYQTNITQDNVKYFAVTATWDATKGLYDIPNSLSVSSYDPFQLYKTITKDENWVSGNNNTTEEFKDKEGRVVLKRTYNNTVKHDTYYIYDQFGNLTFVLPPMVDTNQTITSTVLDNLCYQYKYDHRNRLVEKKLPGKQWEFIVYDKLDRVVATGPTLSPFPDTEGQGWLITKYDAFNRQILTAWLMASSNINSTARASLQSLYSAPALPVNEAKSTYPIVNGADNFQTRYTNVAIPSTYATAYTVLTLDYYDEYASNLTVSPSLSGSPILGQPIYYNSNNKPKGLPTLKWVRLLESPTLYNAEKSYVYYDFKGRPVTNVTNNYLNGYIKVDRELEIMTGRVNRTETRTKRTANDPTLTVFDYFTYTNQDKSLGHTHKINNTGITQLLTYNTYNELGQLISKQVGGADVVNYIGLQKIDYSYNIRGWLKSINDVDALQKAGVPKDLFAFKINYNEVENATNYNGKSLFNGNIAETYWTTSNDDIKRKYGYFYDDLNRLTSAVYQKPNNTVPVTNSYNESLSYDKNGNIQNLQRNGDVDDGINVVTIDNLVYNYSGNNPNLLVSVSDTGTSAGFNDVAGAVDYTYDNNGNMTADANKGITNITYNHLNLPTTVTFGTTGTIDYLYNATGKKLKKVVTEGTNVNTTHYLNDGYQYSQVGTTGAVVLDFFPHAEGYVKNTVVNSANVYSYIFNYTDHLGNVRLSYTKNQTTGNLDIIEENNYYPFGLKHKPYNYTSPTSYKYKYNGKEFQDEMGLNMYDYGARNYDPAIGRWMNIDPLAEQYRRWSPYTYCINNPMRFVDPDGMRVTPPDWVEYTTKDGKQSVTYDPEIKTTEQAKTKGYENVKQVVSSTTATNNVNGDKIQLNANGTYSVNGGPAIDPADQPYTEGGARIDYNSTPLGQFASVLSGAGDGLTATGAALASTGIGALAGGVLMGVGGTLSTVGTSAEIVDDISNGKITWDNPEKAITKVVLTAIPECFKLLGPTLKQEAAMEVLIMGLDKTLDEGRQYDFKGFYQRN